MIQASRSWLSHPCQALSGGLPPPLFVFSAPELSKAHNWLKGAGRAYKSPCTILQPQYLQRICLFLSYQLKVKGLWIVPCFVNASKLQRRAFSNVRLWSIYAGDQRLKRAKSN